MTAAITIAVSLIALVLTALAVRYARRTVPPRLELTVGVTVTPLLPTGTTPAHGRISMRYEDGGDLDDPHLVQVELHNTGAAAISKEMYDGDPYIVRFGTKAVDLLRETNSMPQRTAPDVRLITDELRIGPGAIHRGQRLTYAVLIDGQDHIDRICPILNINLVEAETHPESRTAAQRRAGRQIVLEILVILGMAVLGALAIIGLIALSAGYLIR